jgi:hypothetical protein
MSHPKVPAQLSLYCGSLLSIAVTIDFTNILRSCILGAVGTIVSYAISRLLKALFE